MQLERRHRRSALCQPVVCYIVIVTIYQYSFYRAMHYSAKRGIEIGPSVRLSVTLVDQDHIGWKS